MVRFICVLGLSALGIALGGAAWREFLDLPSLLITLGGALGVTFLTYPWARLRDLAALLGAVFTAGRPDREDLARELARLGRLYRLKGARGLEGQEGHIADPYLRRGLGLLIDMQSEQDIRAEMEGAFESVAARYRAAGQILFTLGKLLPTFGLIGTLIGLVLLLRQMSGSEPEALTASFGLALMTTLYGALFANVVVLPLGAKLESAEGERTALMRAVLEWTLALARGAAPAAVERRLAALAPAEASDRPGAKDERPWRPFLWQR
ncbi:MAG TPA: MotA/TolQ/ExbB proton channel family protein [Candidatus Binatia bacterium]